MRYIPTYDKAGNKMGAKWWQPLYSVAQTPPPWQPWQKTEKTEFTDPSFNPSNMKIENFQMPALQTWPTPIVTGTPGKTEEPGKKYDLPGPDTGAILKPYTSSQGMPPTHQTPYPTFNMRTAMMPMKEDYLRISPENIGPNPSPNKPAEALNKKQGEPEARVGEKGTLSKDSKPAAFLETSVQPTPLASPWTVFGGLHPMGQPVATASLNEGIHTVFHPALSGIKVGKAVNPYKTRQPSAVAFATNPLAFHPDATVNHPSKVGAAAVAQTSAMPVVHQQVVGVTPVMSHPGTVLPVMPHPGTVIPYPITAHPHPAGIPPHFVGTAPLPAALMLHPGSIVPNPAAVVPRPTLPVGHPGIISTVGIPTFPLMHPFFHHPSLFQPGSFLEESEGRFYDQLLSSQHANTKSPTMVIPPVSHRAAVSHPALLPQNVQSPWVGAPVLLPPAGLHPMGQPVATASLNEGIHTVFHPALSGIKVGKAVNPYKTRQPSAVAFATNPLAFHPDATVNHPSKVGAAAVAQTSAMPVVHQQVVGVTPVMSHPGMHHHPMHPHGLTSMFPTYSIMHPGYYPTGYNPELPWFPSTGYLDPGYGVPAAIVYQSKEDRMKNWKVSPPVFHPTMPGVHQPMPGLVHGGSAVVAPSLVSLLPAALGQNQHDYLHMLPWQQDRTKEMLAQFDKKKT